MKKAVIVISFVFIYETIFSVQTGQIHAVVTGLKNSSGSVIFYLYDSDKGFPSKPAYAVEKITVRPENGEAAAVFSGIPYGIYAVAVLHDENANGQIDSNFLKIPREGLGVSNNPRPKFGPPSFREASFTLDVSREQLAIKLVYL